MKSIAIILAVVGPFTSLAQTSVDRTIPVKSGQTISMHFDYPELIRVTSWDRNEVSISGKVSINGGENDDAFVLTVDDTRSTIDIRSEIRDIKQLPQRITMVREGQKVMFRDKEALRAYQSQHGSGYESISWGPEVEIHLEIKVPKNTPTHIAAEYGMVEVRDFSGPLVVDARFGGVDAALVERAIGELAAQTEFGQIYTNLNKTFTPGTTSGDFQTSITARSGNGPKYSFESRFGNIYLRKAQDNQR